MTYTALQMFMENLNNLIYCNHNPLINNNPSILSERPQFQWLYQEFGNMIQTLFIHKHHHLHELQKLRFLKRRFTDAAEEAQDVIDLFLSAHHFRNNIGILRRSDVFKTSLDLEKIMRSIESIKVELMTINMDNMEMDSSSRIDRPKTRSAADAAKTFYTRNPYGTKKPSEEIVVGLDRDAELIRDKLAEDTKQLGIVSIVGMGGLGKTTLATKLFNDRFVVYHFHIRAWATVSQTYIKRDFLIQTLTSSNVRQDLLEASDSQLREKLHKHLMGKRFLIVIDDIWSTEAWDELKLLFPHENTGSRILLTSRLNEVALHAKPHGFVHSLSYLTEERSWELLREKVFHGDECPKSLIKPGMQIAKNCRGLPLSVVVMAGVLAKEVMSKDFWEKIASGVCSYIVSDQKGTMETLALSYHHLPHHLRDCFLYLGGFPEDFRFVVERLIWLWGAEGFIEEVGIRSMEETAKAYLLDLVDRNLVIIAERKFNGDVKACKLHDLVRELCQQKAKEERFFHKIDPPQLFSQPPEVTIAYKQRRLFTNQDITFMNFARPPTPSIRSILCFHQGRCMINKVAKNLRCFALLRVLDLQTCELHYFPQGIAVLVHLRYLAMRYSLGFPSSICNLWCLQTLILKKYRGSINLPRNMSDLVNLRHLWSNAELIIPTTEKPMKLLSISEVRYGDGVDMFGKCFPSIKKLVYVIIPGEECHFELLPSLETLKLRVSGYPKDEPNFRQINHIWFPATLKKLTLERCCLPWSAMSIIQSLPKLEVLKLKEDAFEGTQWNTGEKQFPQLKVLRLEELNIKHWVAYSTSFPCLKRLSVWMCDNLEEIPLEIGEIATLELIETDSWNYSIVESVKRIQEEQHDEGNTELKITVDGMELPTYLSVHEGSESEIEISSPFSSGHH
ncbi:putative late blight resistance protein homolog R1B-12 [Cynara cardunculus var. scolymus]|uniref:putative late blight resistance protein homolog R1B-12 n=1 Tax=Cynara cardunculus var. scolymus TaxID=59895 RepID=UPI000D625524|nr:putative late blight resistance protein homolog R1B-12 [Cynara cardunculus var. scolymus]